MKGRPKERHFASCKYSMNAEGKMVVCKRVKADSRKGFDSYLKAWSDGIEVKLQSFNLSDELMSEVLRIASSVHIGEHEMAPAAEALHTLLRGVIKRIKVEVLIHIVFDMNVD